MTHRPRIAASFSRLACEPCPNARLDRAAGHCSQASRLNSFHPISRRRGYVLVVTLALLVLGATLMVAVSRAALRHALAAREAADDLRHHWGVISVRTAVLPYAESILTAAEITRKSPVPSVRARVTLADETFELLLSDEAAKANVNLLLAGTDRSTAEIRLREALGGSGLGNNLRLRPGAVILPGDEDLAITATRPSTQPAVADLISGYGQIFENLGPADLLLVRGGARATDLLTCWGNGEINLRRVTPAALRVAAGTSLSGVEQARILEARDAILVRHEAPKPTPNGPPVPANDPIAALLATAGLDLKKAKGLPRFVLNSNCYSVWIVSTDQRRVTYFLGVKDDSIKDHPRTAAFVW